MKQKQILIFIIFIILAAAIAILAWLNRPDTTLDNNSVTIYTNGEEAAVLDLPQLEALPAITFEKEIISGSGANQKGNFTGVDLKTILDTIDPNWAQNAKRIDAQATDGFNTSYDLAEVLEKENVILIYQFNGDYLKPLSTKGDGPFRIVVRADAFGNRCIRNLYRLEVQ